MKTLRNIGIAAVIVAGVLILGLGYYGFVPGLSAALGSSKPRDLKISPTPQDLAAARAKYGVDMGVLPAGVPPEDSIAFSGTTEVDADFTDKELTALLRNADWHYDMIDKGEVRINADGTLELSGLLRLDRAYGYARAHRIDMRALRPYLRALESFTHHPAFYVKIRASWADGHLSMEVIHAEIGRYEVEPEVLKAHAAEITAVVEENIAHVPGMEIRAFSFVDGKLHFEGTLPQSVRLSP